MVFLRISSLFLTFYPEEKINGTCSCATCAMKDSCPNALPAQNMVTAVSGGVQSWNDLIAMPPADPRDLIGNAVIAGTTVQFLRSNSFTISSGTWITSPFSLGPSAPVCAALGVDSYQCVEWANQWNFDHLTAKVGDSLTALPLLKLAFLRAGTQWKNIMRLNLGPATYNDLQLSYRDNAATRGDAQGTIPVISFTGGNLTGNVILEITLKRTGHFMMGLRGIDGSSNRSMYEMEWIVVG